MAKLFANSGDHDQMPHSAFMGLPTTMGEKTTFPHSFDLSLNTGSTN